LKQQAFILLVALLLTGVAGIESCKKDNDVNGGEGNTIGTPLKLEIPAGWPQPEPLFQNNPLTVEGFDLGKRLFYDGRLSKDGNFPCASCHQQFAAFATYDHDLSHGFDNQFTMRNSPGLFNMAWQKAFHWDGGINHLEVQPLAPITAPNEMAENIDTVLAKLRKDSKYLQQFKAAFGDETINSQRMLKALSQFVGSLVSYNSKYDKVKRGESSFSTAESQGYALFKANCATCHKEPLFTDLSYRNTGLPINTSLRDFGRMRITGLSSDSLKFKVPSLRNAQITFPYMHDGRFYSLQQAVDHYRTGIQNSATLDPLLINKIPLTIADRDNIIAFLRTLTDAAFTSDPRFEAPK
jgi:cytochrome c peroxidase